MTATAEKTGTYIIWGSPGTGKTTHLADKTREFVEWAAKWHPDNRTPVLLCSLTRTAAAEIAGRDLPLPPECVGTLHSHAYRSLDCPPVAESLAADFNEDHPAYRISTVGRSNGDEPEWDRRAGTPGDRLAQEYHLLRARMTDRRLWKPRVLAFAARWEAFKTEAGCVDFTDMIELALRESDLAPGGPEIVIADEAQDLSALEYALLAKWGQAAGRLIITGDPYQSLYVWRGAHPEIFLDERVPADQRRVLSRSWRVPAAVHAAAMRWVSQLSCYRPIDYAPRDAAGEVLTSSATWKAPERAVDLAEKHLAAGRSVMFAASCSFFLSPLLAILRKRGLPFGNPWRLKRGDWNPLAARRGAPMARRLLDFLRYDVPTCGADSARPWTYDELGRWTAPLRADGLLVRGAKRRIRASTACEGECPQVDMTELYELFHREPLEELLGMLADRDGDAGETKVKLAELLAWYSDRLLASKRRAARYPLKVARLRGAAALSIEPKLHVGTIHSFKGAEADVVIVFPDLSPAGLREWIRPGAPRDSVVRLFYVALTRARQTLVACAPASAVCVNLRRMLT